VCSSDIRINTFLLTSFLLNFGGSIRPKLLEDDYTRLQTGPIAQTLKNLQCFIFHRTLIQSV
jgi:hypothetical protein